MRAYINLGSSPAEETCAQVGEDGYEVKAYQECSRYRELIRKTLGKEPEGAKLAVKSFPHDFGNYCELVCYFEDDNRQAMEYAYLCESKAPVRWEEENDDFAYEGEMIS